ncbi:MAG: carboxypeptidase regulatory-like domain-containing protein, partial [Candidatus Nanoarchaeia archaeon]
PNIAADGNTAYVVWINIDDPGSFDGWSHPTLRVRKTTDGGATLGDSVILKDYPAGYHTGCQAGLETVAICGSSVIVVTCGKDSFAGTWLWRSADGNSWPSSPLQLSTGGWWPLVSPDPITSTKVHIVNYNYYVSKDSGATFDGGEAPQVQFWDWQKPRMLIDSFGVFHYTAACDRQILYRRLATPHAPGATNKALNLVNESPRYDNMQVPATEQICFTESMTMEFWGYLAPDYAQNMYFVQKLCPGYDPSYSIGMGDPGYTSANNIKCHILKKSDEDANPVTITIEPPFTVPRATWTHLAMTYDANVASDNLKLYANGTLVAKATVNGKLYNSLIDSPLIVGSTGNQSGTFQIDELRLWNKARTQSEIAATMTSELSGNEPGLVAYYNFNDTTKDITGNGHDGVLHYMETFNNMNPTYPPFLSTLNPADSSTNVATNTKLEMTFNEDIKAGTGNITVMKGDFYGSVIDTIDVTDTSKVAITGKSVSITLTNVLENDTKYFIKVPNTCIKGATSNIEFIGVMSPDTWSFTTGSQQTTYSISGSITGAVQGGVTLTLSGAATATTTSAADGTYSFANLANGNYTVTPSLNGYTFTPASQDVTINGANVTSCNFTASAVPPGSYTISGAISGAVQQGVTLNLSGAATATTTSAADGTYSFANLANGSYIVTPSLTGYTFSPPSISVTISEADQTGKNFIASAVQPGTYSISGTIAGDIQQGVLLRLSGNTSATTTSGADGNYTFANLANGTYTVTPSLAGYTFTPSKITVTLSNANQTGKDFTATESPVNFDGNVSKLSFSSSHKGYVKAYKEDGGTYYMDHYTDKFVIQATIEFLSNDFDIGSINEDTEFSFELGEYLFPPTKLGDSDEKGRKLNGEKGGSVKFTSKTNDEVKNKDVVVEKVELKWTSKKKVTVKIIGTPVTDDPYNIIDLSGEQDSKNIQGSIDNFAVVFHKHGAMFYEEDVLDYTGSKITRTVCKGKGEDQEIFN